MPEMQYVHAFFGSMLVGELVHESVGLNLKIWSHTLHVLLSYQLHFREQNGKYEYGNARTLFCLTAHVHKYEEGIFARDIHCPNQISISLITDMIFLISSM